MATEIKHPDIEVRLSGEDGNVFSVISRVQRALRRAGFPEDAEEFGSRAHSASSYDDVIQLAMRTVDVI